MDTKAHECAAEPHNATVRSIATQIDGKVLVAGDFDTFNGIPRSFVVRLFGDPAPSPLLTIGREGANVVVVSWPTNSLPGFTLQWTRDLACPATWNDSTDVPFIVGTNFTVANP